MLSLLVTSLEKTIEECYSVVVDLNTFLTGTVYEDASTISFTAVGFRGCKMLELNHRILLQVEKFSEENRAAGMMEELVK